MDLPSPSRLRSHAQQSQIDRKAEQINKIKQSATSQERLDPKALLIATNTNDNNTQDYREYKSTLMRMHSKIITEHALGLDALVNNKEDNNNSSKVVLLHTDSDLQLLDGQSSSHIQQEREDGDDDY